MTLSMWKLLKVRIASKTSEMIQNKKAIINPKGKNKRQLKNCPNNHKLQKSLHKYIQVSSILKTFELKD